MKQVWVKSATCSWTRSTTAGAALPTLVTAMPEPKSISELPSASTTTPPPARVTKTGSAVPMPGGTAACLRASSSCDFGPGISVTRRRSCGQVLMARRYAGRSPGCRCVDMSHCGMRSLCRNGQRSYGAYAADRGATPARARPLPAAPRPVGALGGRQRAGGSHPLPGGRRTGPDHGHAPGRRDSGRICRPAGRPGRRRARLRRRALARGGAARAASRRPPRPGCRCWRCRATTPFIAIGKAVSDLLAAEQYDEITRAFAAQGRLTRAALRTEGPCAVIDRLAKELGGWAAAAGRGTARYGTPPAPPRPRRRRRELARLRGEHGAGGAAERTGGRPRAWRSPRPDEHVVVQPLGGRPRPRGFFVVGASAGVLARHADGRQRGRVPAHARRRAGRRAAGRRAAGALGRAGAPAGRGGAGGAGRGSGARCWRRWWAAAGGTGGGAGGGGRRARRGGAARCRARLRLTLRPLPLGSPVVVLVAAAQAEKVASLAGGTVGMSAPSAYGELPGALDQARRAFESGRDGLVRFADLAGQGLLSLLDPAAAQAFASALLAPAHARYGSRADLMESLRAYIGMQRPLGRGGPAARRAPPHAPLPHEAGHRTAGPGPRRSRRCAPSSGSRWRLTSSGLVRPDSSRSSPS